jgi:CheY-like chemotaxis protein
VEGRLVVLAVAQHPIVLVVDDDALSRLVLARRLYRWGYEPVQLGDAATALAHLESETADALIADVEMPGIDGLSLARQALARCPSLPVFLVTACPRPETWTSATAAGVRDVLPKQAGGAESLRQALAAALHPELAGREDLALAHSLRTPLAALKGALDILCSGRAGDLPESQRRFAGIARRNADRMISLVEELLESAARP